LVDLELEGKTAIVTGASRGIGKAIAHVLAAEGVDVALVARPSDSLEQAAAEISQASGRRVIAVSADAGVDAQVKAAVEHVVQTFGHIDILVNSAARPGGNPARLAELTDEAFFPDLNIKVLGYTRFIREVAPHMQRRRWGRIINVVGMAARVPVGIMSGVRNAAVVAMSRNVAEQLGQHGITVNVVHPFAVRTERSIAQVRELAEREGLSLEAAEQRRLADGNLLRRTIDASEIAFVVAFLASPKGVAVNGEAIAVTGGTPGWVIY
jgi:NAD(P)-dependent dehydrogenase (short-subunit alcohol dehydrogenase family)